MQGEDSFLHIPLYKESKYKAVTLALIFIASAMELFGISLIYPLIFLFFDLGEQEFELGRIIVELLERFGLPISKEVLVISIIFTLFLKAGFSLLYRYFCTLSVLSYQIKLREEIFQLLFDTRTVGVEGQVGRIHNALITQAPTASSAMQNQFHLIQNVVMLSALCFLGLLLSLKLLIVAIITGSIVYLGMSYTIRYAKRLGVELAKSNEDYVKQSAQTTKSYRYLKGISGYKKLFPPIQKIIKKIYRVQIRFVLLNRGTQIMTEPIVLAAMTVVLFFGLQVLHYEIALIMVIYVVLARMYFQLVGTMGVAQGYFRDLVSVQYCNDLIEELSVESERDGSRDWSGIKRNIALDKVTFNFGDKNILDMVDVEFPANQITAIVGNTGCGKTTLLNILIGLYSPGTGSVRIDGTELNTFKQERFRNNLGLVEQNPALLNLTIEENLKFRNNEVCKTRIIDYINRFELLSIFPNGVVNLDWKLDEVGSGLSGGERQRLALIREILAEPDLLILDEITSGLDSRMSTIVANELARLKSSMTIILVTHHLENFPVADQIYKLDGGSLNRI